MNAQVTSRNATHNHGMPDDWYCICRTSTRYGAPVLKATVTRQGCTINKGFTVSHYGTEENTLKAAQTWRDAVLALLPPMTYTQLRSKHRKNSSSGITGVYREERNNRGAEWVARIEVSGKARTASFSVKLHGEEQAKALAIGAREQFLREADDKFFVVSETAKVMAERNFGSHHESEDSRFPKAADDSIKEVFLQRLRDAGLIGKPPTPPVQRRHFDSSNSPVWEARISLPDGTRKTRRFSVSVYGEDGAKRLAESVAAELLTKQEVQPYEAESVQIKKGFAEALAEHPNEMLAVALDILKLKSDAALAKRLGFAPPVISKIRKKKIPLGATFLVSLLDDTDMHIRVLYQHTLQRLQIHAGNATSNRIPAISQIPQ